MKCRRCNKPTQFNFCSQECAKANNIEMAQGDYASPEATRLQSSYAAFQQAHEAVHEAELATKHIYCLCGREFPTGKVSRIVYGIVQYADDRCGQCEAI